MSDKDSAQSVIEAYRKRQQRSQNTPKLLFVLMAVLIVVGAAILIFWLVGGTAPSLSMFMPKPTETATPTATHTTTSTPTATQTATVTTTPVPTDTPTPTATETPSSPFIYIVDTGDNLTTISEKFNVADPCLIIELNPKIDKTLPIIYAGQDLLIPPPGLTRPTATPFPLGVRLIIDYMVEPGEGLFQIAQKFNSTVDAIEKENDFDEETVLQACQLIKVPINLVAPAPTFTQAPVQGTPGTIMTITPSSTPTP